MKNFDYLRKKQNLSLNNLSKLTNIPLRTLENISAGKNQPSLQTLIELRKFFDVNLDDLIFKNIEQEDLNKR